jgi:hypothetical protein
MLDCTTQTKLRTIQFKKTGVTNTNAYRLLHLTKRQFTDEGSQLETFVKP